MPKRSTNAAANGAPIPKQTRFSDTAPAIVSWLHPNSSVQRDDQDANRGTESGGHDERDEGATGDDPRVVHPAHVSTLTE